MPQSQLNTNNSTQSKGLRRNSAQCQVISARCGSGRVSAWETVTQDPSSYGANS